MSPSAEKILTYDSAVSLAKVLNSGAFKLVITNGCFDILHAGHIKLLETARSFGDMLLVGVNSDAAVKALKGKDRPINTLDDRMAVLAALSCVSYVVPVGYVRLEGFIRDMKARVWAKGGDYTLETLDRGEVASAKEVGTEIKLVPVVPGVSTTGILSRHDQRTSQGRSPGTLSPQAAN